MLQTCHHWVQLSSFPHFHPQKKVTTNLLVKWHGPHYTLRTFANASGVVVGHKTLMSLCWPFTFTHTFDLDSKVRRNRIYGRLPRWHTKNLMERMLQHRALPSLWIGSAPKCVRVWTSSLWGVALQRCAQPNKITNHTPQPSHDCNQRNECHELWSLTKDRQHRPHFDINVCGAK